MSSALRVLWSKLKHLYYGSVCLGGEKDHLAWLVEAIEKPLAVAKYHEKWRGIAKITGSWWSDFWAKRAADADWVAFEKENAERERIRLEKLNASPKVALVGYYTASQGCSEEIEDRSATKFVSLMAEGLAPKPLDTSLPKASKSRRPRAKSVVRRKK